MPPHLETPFPLLSRVCLNVEGKKGFSGHAGHVGIAVLGLLTINCQQLIGIFPDMRYTTAITSGCKWASLQLSS